MTNKDALESDTIRQNIEANKVSIDDINRLREIARRWIKKQKPVDWEHQFY